jgi:CheY-like chemotaxis protein
MKAWPGSPATIFQQDAPAGAQIPRPESSEPVTAATRQGPILIVDDDPTILKVVRDILESEGYRVRVATNGAAALHAILDVKPSLVLLDMRMPIVNGWDFVREIRARNIAVPIVVMTAARDAEAWANEIGAVGFLAKPFDLPDLLQAVDTFRDH